MAVRNEWVVKDLLPKQGVALVAGPSMAGKSFLTLDMMDCIARGRPVLGRRSYQCGVAYVAAEGANGVRKRIEGLRQDRGAHWSGHMVLCSEPPNLADEDSFLELGRALRARQRAFASRNIRLGVVVIDTLSASIPGADENSAKDMSPVLDRLQKVARSLDVCVLLVAHVGKAADRSVRGWSGIVANADGLIQVDAADAEGLRTVSIVKVKDGDSGKPVAFKLKVIDLGEDDDGDPVTTCVVDWDVPAPAASAGERRPRPLPAGAHTILAALKRLTDNGATVPVSALGAPAGTIGVAYDTLKATAFADRLGGPEPDDEHDRRLWKDRRRKALEGGLSRLAQRGLVRSENGTVWLLEQTTKGSMQ